MNPTLATIFALAAVMLFGSPAFGRKSATGVNATAQSARKQKRSTRPGREVANGGKDIGRGAGKGAVSMAKGTAGAAGDLVTLHPVDAGVSLGKGAGGLGKDVGVGTAKGSAKIGKGAGKELGKLGRKVVHHGN